MSYRQTLRFALAATAALCVLGLFAVPAVAAPSSALVAADRAKVDRAVKRFEAAQRKSAQIRARVERTSAALDGVIADQRKIRDRLSSRARLMYRSGDTSFVSVLLGAATFQEFASRWELLTRMSRQDAQDLRDLALARRKAERSAESLLDLQGQEARAVDAAARELARARKELSTSQAALAQYLARTSKSAKRTASKPARKSDSTQKLRGSGAWKTGVASHYSRTFTGRGANGERIGPYTMMCAHKTLPFGTLIEFEYGGKRAVARVADRGPHSAGRDFDLGPGVVRALDFSGVHEVRYRIINR